VNGRINAGENRQTLANPRAELLGKQNAILSGTSTCYYVPDFEGCLSIKSVLSGSAVWETPQGRRFEVHENTYLILNDRQHYRMTIDSARKVTTFCIFFERGLVEDVFRAKRLPTPPLLDQPEPARPEQVGFIERIEGQQGPVGNALEKLRRRLATGRLSTEESVADFYALAERLLAEQHRIRAVASRLPALRRSTRDELLRRVLRGRDFLLSSLSERVHLKDAARAACLSPFHFHRAFHAAFGETPHQHTTRLRLERARQLLAKSDRSVTEICLASGFESLGSFSTLFRRTYGAPPGHYRDAQIRKN
jgi:AraC family transcriptional regulator